MKRNKSKEDYKQTERRGFIRGLTVYRFIKLLHILAVNALQTWIDSLFLTCWKANHPFNDFGTLPFEQWYGAELSADGLKTWGQVLKWYKCSVLHWTKPAGTAFLPLSCALRFTFHPLSSRCPHRVLVPQRVRAAVCLAPRQSFYGAKKLPRSVTCL